MYNALFLCSNGVCKNRAIASFSTYYKFFYPQLERCAGKTNLLPVKTIPLKMGVAGLGCTKASG